jgi:cytochrome c6
MTNHDFIDVRASVGYFKGDQMNRIKVHGLWAVLLAGVVCFIYSPIARAQGDAAGLYAAKCAACHGPDGTAQTPAGKAVKARDFHTPEVQTQTDDQLIAIVASGKNKMPAYGKVYKDTQIKDLVAYCRALGKK